MSKTLLTKKQQAEFLDNNRKARTLEHRWSTAGMGSSRIVAANGDVLGKAGGCGYDRLGAAIGHAMMHLFGDELLTLAKRQCKGKRRDYKGSDKFYGLFYDAVKGRAWLDGGCGQSSMKTILNKIGFSLEYVGERDCGNRGSAFYVLRPISKSDYKFL